ncbi:MAG: hypothetical protein M3464_02130 [Chloroflexota bacterium]|nr:hypothetical protein [Chloroflexota bacterium]
MSATIATIAVSVDAKSDQAVAPVGGSFSTKDRSRCIDSEALHLLLAKKLMEPIHPGRHRRHPVPRTMRVYCHDLNATEPQERLGATFGRLAESTTERADRQLQHDAALNELLRPDEVVLNTRIPLRVRKHDSLIRPPALQKVWRPHRVAIR